MRQQQGFTLIEMMVVVVVLGCVISFANFSGNGNHARVLRHEAQQLESIINLVLDEATMENREHGVLFDDTGYSVLRYDELQERWYAERKRQQLPETLRMSLTVEGKALSLGPAVTPTEQRWPPLATTREVGEPQLLMFSSGELLPFTLRIEDRRNNSLAYVLQSDGFQRPNAVIATP